MTAAPAFPFHKPGRPIPPPPPLDTSALTRAWQFADRPAHPLTEHEPDKLQWLDRATGLDCLIVRNIPGALCGYVGVTRQYRQYGKRWDDDDVGGLRVHGGITFADRCHEDAPEGTGICHVPFAGRSDDIWWLGFDCAHAWDRCPWLEAGHAIRREPMPGSNYCDLSYVIGEVESLARQLKEANRP